MIVLKFASKFSKAISIYIHVHDKSAEVLFAYYLIVSKVHLSLKKKTLKFQLALKGDSFSTHSLPRGLPLTSKIVGR